MKALMIAAPSSGAGKTTVSRALIALLTRRGYRVQPFKCGPDYIDTKFHEHVCHRASVNLDTFMATEQHVRELFHRYSADADIAIVEGMMGLYDGYGRDRGSSADIARVPAYYSHGSKFLPIHRGFAPHGCPLWNLRGCLGQSLSTLRGKGKESAYKSCQAILSPESDRIVTSKG